jgi:hypothetical protein
MIILKHLPYDFRELRGSPSPIGRNHGYETEDRSGRHLDGEHLFQAKRQRAELDTVGLAACLVAAALVFDGKRTPTAPASRERNALLASTTGQEFNDVGLPRKAESIAMQRQSSADESARS